MNCEPLKRSAQSWMIPGVMARVNLRERWEPSQPRSNGAGTKGSPSLQLSPRSFVTGREGRRCWLACHRSRGPAALRRETCVKVLALGGLRGRKRLFSLLPCRKPVWKPALRQVPRSCVAGRERDGGALVGKPSSAGPWGFESPLLRQGSGSSGGRWTRGLFNDPFRVRLAL
jgi:hypothetical protein